MKTRAAVAWKAGAPLSIETVDLEGPKAGEVLVEIKATGVCHTDAFTLSGDDPEGVFPAVLGHEGAGLTDHPVTVIRLPVGEALQFGLQRGLRLADDLLSQRSDTDLTATALEDLQLQLFLKLLDGHRKGRLGNKTSLRCSSEVALPGHRDDVSQLRECHGALLCRPGPFV